ncbi:MAG: SDR family NAD(P)-dependent oxidoreductase, partial [Gammaproteobacteria bacterium]|nr:SDR family NAD(P)-dependent oxidoreductase [Gammaproteobacteria bacterium]
MAEYRPQLGAEEASADIDMTGKTAIVTGGSAGLGIETIRVLAKQGAKAVSVVRNLEKGQNAINSILESVPGADIDLVQLDLFDLESVKKGADVIAAKYPKIDLLINNAGIMAAPLSRTREGL